MQAEDMLQMVSENIRNGCRQLVYQAVILTVAFLTGVVPIVAFAQAGGPELWISPMDSVTQRGADFHDYFDRPEDWSHAAKAIKVFSVAVRYLQITPPDILLPQLKRLHDLGLRLDLSIPAVAADKHVCGDGVEGIIWPGEVEAFTRKLKDLGVDVYSFSLDLPLTAGYLLEAPKACRLTIRETAARTAKTVAAVLAIYPNAKIIDTEVPTGIPVARWSATLTEWLNDYKHFSGRDFDGFSMDVWFKFDWQPSVAETIRILTPLHIPAGIFIDASGYRDSTAGEWINTSKKNACALKASGMRLDYIAIANWQNSKVRALPETDPGTLTGLLTWFAKGPECRG